jgi:phospholipid/cholesterol/gamma-HCH transport system substrate-binding protein
MDRNTRNVMALGAITVIAIVVFFWGLYYLLGNSVLRGGMDVVVALESGGGLKRGDRVTLQGVEVGSVRDIQLRGARGVTAALRLNHDYPLPADTRATVSGDVFGAHTVELLPGKALVKLEAGDTLLGANAPVLTEQAVGLTTSARVVLERANALLDPEAVRDLHATAEDIRATTSVLPGSAEQLREAFRELRLASASLRRTAESLESSNAGQALATAISRVDSTARVLTAIASSIDSSAVSVKSVFSKIDRGDGSLGRLVNDTTLYSELSGAAREIKALATDMKTNPNRYLTIKVF